MEKNKIFLDADTLFDGIIDQDVETLLSHANNAGYKLYVPLTVLGEIMLNCIDENRRDDLNNIMSLCANINILYTVPNKQLRECCVCIDGADKRDRLDYTDKTNLGYATAYNADYFLTTDKKLLHNFSFECKDQTKIISYKALKKILDK
jgi:predicted nucleic acid-binding protein